MGMAWRRGPMVLSTTEITCTVRSTAWADSLGLTAAPTLATSRRTISRGRAPTTGPMEECSLAPGSTIRWRAGAPSRGPMAASTKASILMTRRRGRACSFGLMAGNTRAAGRMANSMAMDTTRPPPARSSRVSGTRARDCSGSPKGRRARQQALGKQRAVRCAREEGWMVRLSEIGIASRTRLENKHQITHNKTTIDASTIIVLNASYLSRF